MKLFSEFVFKPIFYLGGLLGTLIVFTLVYLSATISLIDNPN